jgi:FlaA1/EpsC-like NDP-sugar epimerase
LSQLHDSGEVREFLLNGKENNLHQHFQMRPIDEQTIFITGATSGLGRELAQALAKQGATLLLHGRKWFSKPDGKS